MATYKNITESGIVKSKGGKIKGIVVNSHTSGTLALVDGTEPSVAASSVITSAGACAPASHAVTILTSDGTAFSEDETVTINTTVYRFKAVPVAIKDILIGTAAESLDYLKCAINGVASAGVFTGTPAHATVVATTNSDTQQTLRARVPGVTPNAYPTTETCAHASFPDTTLGGGTGASDPGVTTAAATIIINGRVYTAVLELSETLGAAARVDQILWVTSEAVFLDNLKKAINASGTAGTEYSTGTLVNADVVATTNTNTQQTIVSKLLGTVGNAITTTTTLANYSWTGAVLASGTGATGSVMHSTITLEAVVTVGDRFIPFFDEEFTRGLYITVGGVADFTIVLDC